LGHHINGGLQYLRGEGVVVEYPRWGVKIGRGRVPKRTRKEEQ
jgi:hypothetical protein